MGARLAAASFPTTLEFQIGKGVAGPVRLFPDPARKTDDQFRVCAIAEFLDRLPFGFWQFQSHVDLPKNSKGKRQDQKIRFRFVDGIVAPERQAKSLAI